MNVINVKYILNKLQTGNKSQQFQKNVKNMYSMQDDDYFPVR